MKFVLKQEKFQDLLEKLIVKDMFPSSIITTKDGNLFSIQKEEHGRALRFLNVKGSFFDEINNTTETIELDVEKALNMIKNILPNTLLTIQTKGEKLSILGKNIDANISYKDPESEVLASLQQANMEMKEGIPIVGDTKTKLDNYFTIKLPDFKDLAGFASSLKTEFYKFGFDKDKIAVRIGDLHKFSDYVIFNPDGKIKKGEDLDVTFTYGIPQISETFGSKEINIKTKTNSPGWFYEGTEEYVLGLMIPPYIQE